MDKPLIPFTFLVYSNPSESMFDCQGNEWDHIFPSNQNVKGLTPISVDPVVMSRPVGFCAFSGVLG